MNNIFENTNKLLDEISEMLKREEIRKERKSKILKLNKICKKSA